MTITKKRKKAKKRKKEKRKRNRPTERCRPGTSDFARRSNSRSSTHESKIYDITRGTALAGLARSR